MSSRHELIMIILAEVLIKVFVMTSCYELEFSLSQKLTLAQPD